MIVGRLSPRNADKRTFFLNYNISLIFHSKLSKNCWLIISLSPWTLNLRYVGRLLIWVILHPECLLKTGGLLETLEWCSLKISSSQSKFVGSNHVCFSFWGRQSKKTFSELFCNFLVKTDLCKSFFCFLLEKHIIVPNSNGKTFQVTWKFFQISIKLWKLLFQSYVESSKSFQNFQVKF